MTMISNKIRHLICLLETVVNSALCFVIRNYPDTLNLVGAKFIIWSNKFNLHITSSTSLSILVVTTSGVSLL